MRSWNILLPGLVSAALFGACSRTPQESSETKVGGRQSGTLKGLEAYEDIINERVFQSGAANLRSYLEDPNEEATGLVALLGAFSEVVGFSFQEKAVPNSVNSFLWETVAAGFAKDLAAQLCAPSAEALKEAFFAAGHSLCGKADTAGAAAAHAAAMRSLWMKLMRYDAPEAEMNAWIAEESAADGIVSTLTGEARLEALLQSILMNPYFMLER